VERNRRHRANSCWVVCGSEKVLIATEAQCSGNLGSWGTRYALSGAGATRLSWLVHGGAKDDDSGRVF
jgi:hypothetical protein